MFKKNSEKKYSQESWNKGMARVYAITKFEESMGYKAYATGMYADICDIVVVDENNQLGGKKFSTIVRVYECTNYRSPKSYVPRDRGTRYYHNLMKVNCERVFVCSFENNLRSLPNGRKYFTKRGIKVLVFGYQDW